MKTIIKTWIRFTSAIITFSLLALPSLAATISLVPSTSSVSEGEQFTVDLVMDAADENIGEYVGIFRGKVHVTFNETHASYVGFEYNSPAIAFGSTTIDTGSVKLGFDNSSPTATIGTYTFDTLGSAGSTISLDLGDALPYLGSFFNLNPSPLKFTPAFNGAEVSVVPIPAAVWLFSSGLIGLFGVARKRKVSK
ncbi:MAG: hypothetical protein GY727_16075 [Gammaproteobacteria bacterium]|nr:hypothetical protein [Gammaproteobacteria bacterium]MCP4089157.1 hypothetical protein [Gammaproteobacteria bacterium]MCP4276819.1 hypothetical protein [Gammaproteobacteria bacterium]MCP4830662.1 hypothetical protein [Gammaproteobacteria bacterium]MCP4928471.1 hypothetical protein [Gammaproteobacteria bacterium]